MAIFTPNFHTLSPNKILYEGKGIPPDHQVLNSKDDLTDMHDPVLEKALEILQASTAE